MKAWGKILQVPNLPCGVERYNEEDVKVFKTIKENISEKVEGKGYVVFISPLNLWADIYEYDRTKFKSPGNLEKPFDISLDRFRIGFFDEKQKAVDFTLNLVKRLREKFNLHLHVFYT